jgi:hypothetical protein
MKATRFLILVVLFATLALVLTTGYETFFGIPPDVPKYKQVKILG